jgi:hypothetical protein
MEMRNQQLTVNIPLTEVRLFEGSLATWMLAVPLNVAALDVKHCANQTSRKSLHKRKHLIAAWAVLDLTVCSAGFISMEGCWRQAV